MNRVHDDVMDSTTCAVLPTLGRQEEFALFTYNVLLNTRRLETFTVYNLLYTISQHIWYTWDRYLRPSSMDIRWQNETDDTFVLHEEELLVDLLHAHRPHWTEGQEYGLLGQFFFLMNISAILRLTLNLTSCELAAMRPFRTATCFHEINTAGSPFQTCL